MQDLPTPVSFNIEHSTLNIQHSAFRKIAMTTLETRDRLTPGAASSALAEWHYSPSLEATDHVKIQSRYNLFIGGKIIYPHFKCLSVIIIPPTQESSL